ncbi:MAG: hypothetical protein ACXVCX_15485 [Ktedonobacterales bacterium]
MSDPSLTPPEPSTTPNETTIHVSQETTIHVSRDAEHWSQVSKLSVSNVPVGAVNLNVDGRNVVGPLQGFGRLWQKTYQTRLSGANVTPTEVVRVWKERLPEFQPPQNRFFPAVAGVEPGQVVLINASLGGMPVNTGVLVLYADDESFTLMTPEGHPESGWVTFSAYDDDGTTVAQVQSIARANDPIYELGFRLGGSKAQEKIWTHVLMSLAEHFQVFPPVRVRTACVDPRVQWSQAGNVWHNAAMRSALTLPIRIFGRNTRRTTTS